MRVAGAEEREEREAGRADSMLGIARAGAGAPAAAHVERLGRPRAVGVLMAREPAETGVGGALRILLSTRNAIGQTELAAPAELGSDSAASSAPGLSADPDHIEQRLPRIGEAAIETGP